MHSKGDMLLDWHIKYPGGANSRKIVHVLKYAYSEGRPEQVHFDWRSTGIMVEWMPKLNVWRVKYLEVLRKVPQQMLRQHTLSEFPPDQRDEAKQFAESTYLLGESNGQFSIR